MSDAGEFARYLLHLATLEMMTCSTSFTHAHAQPLDLITHLVGDYLQLLATEAKLNAERCGRNNVAVWDLEAAFDQFGIDVHDLVEEVTNACDQDSTTTKQLDQDSHPQSQAQNSDNQVSAEFDDTPVTAKGKLAHLAALGLRGQ